MPTDGLSLLGFMEKQQAIQHLTTLCVPTCLDQKALISEWSAARAALGPPIPKAGTPEILSVPEAICNHVQEVLAQPAFQPGNAYHGASIKLVELALLLAHQFTIDLSRSSHYSRTFDIPPKINQLADCCLPLAPKTEPVQTFPGQASMILKAKSLDVRAISFGVFKDEFVGIMFGVKLPYLHVVRHNGRCYLHNGFHRAYAAAMAKASHAPCVFRDVNDYNAIGISAGIFTASVMESANPPTLRHLIEGRAHRVQLRSHSRFLHVSWAEYAIPDE